MTLISVYGGAAPGPPMAIRIGQSFYEMFVIIRLE